MWVECPNCHEGEFFMACIGGPDYEVNAGAEFEVREQTCSCELNAEQEESLFQYAALNYEPYVPDYD